MLNFVLPTEKDRAAVLAFYDEFEKSGTHCIGMGNHKDFDRWLTGIQNRRLGKDLPEGYVKENFYVCYDKDELVGVFNLKFELTEFLLNFGGHIGYAVRPSKQGRGYATKMLAHGLELAKQIGLDRVLCVCDEDNYASERVIVKNGGVFENTIYDLNDKVMVKRYWISL